MKALLLSLMISTASLAQQAANVEKRFDVLRSPGEKTAQFTGDVRIHRASTSQVECFGAWLDHEDDPAQPAPTQTNPALTARNVSGALARSAQSGTALATPRMMRKAPTVDHPTARRLPLPSSGRSARASSATRRSSDIRRRGSARG